MRASWSTSRWAAAATGVGSFLLAASGLAACQQDPDLPPLDPIDSATVDGSKPDASKDGTTKDSGSGADVDGGSDTGITKPPPIEDTFGVEDYGPPAPGTHVEGVIGAAGGTLEGTSGPLAGVKLVVPPGALAADSLLALDSLTSPGGPPGATVVSPFVRVGPDTTIFVVPARLTLPWKSAVIDPQIGVAARSGFTFTALVEPSVDATSVTVSLGRGTSAEAIHLDVSALKPKITGVAPTTVAAGSVVFVEGAGFGFVPVGRPLGDGGIASSGVTVGGAAASATGWSDGVLSVRMPAGDGGVVQVSTPGGTATGSTVVPP